MAVTVVPLESTLRLELVTGTDANGNPVVRTSSYRGIKPAAADQDVFDVAQAIAGLQVHTLNRISRVNENELMASATV
ncbi:DUF1659 domain-containing protein [Calderihabitans maritimus]|uniref:Uncharacterized conserved protein n=1 Tax=Calderihabitans maritimus TaxID=1246530 RepID=A0A1Z5HVE2_9FIRM|nr:DUF1659 domain-containing protein [Calderihabitans maritimus]GAW93492.1 uncharacterized conserved protein [Calderihabitans maritimus]